MANESNLKPVRSKEEAREKGRKGGIASGKTRAVAKTFKETINAELSNDDLIKIIQKVIKEAQKGNMKAIELLRDTRGEKPTEKISGDLNLSYEDAIKRVSGKDEY